MRFLAAWLLLAGAAEAQDRALVKEYDARRTKVKEKDAAGRTQLALWAASKGLADLAEQEFEAVIAVDTNHARARERLGFRKEKGAWVETPDRRKRQRIRKLVTEGLQLPGREEMDRLAAKGEYHLKVVEFMGWRESWLAALAFMDDNTGLLGESLKVEVAFGSVGEGEVARATGSNGAGRITVDVDRWAATLKQGADFERREKEGTFKIRVPLLRMNSVIIHELVHCFQSGTGTPWVTEGMACYATRDPFYYYYFNYFQGKVAEIDKAGTDQNLHYGRGMAFFDFFEKKYGREKVRELIRLMAQGTLPEEAAAKSSSRPWAEIVREESRWSEQHLRQFRKD